MMFFCRRPTSLQHRQSSLGFLATRTSSTRWTNNHLYHHHDHHHHQLYLHHHHHHAARCLWTASKWERWSQESTVTPSQVFAPSSYAIIAITVTIIGSSKFPFPNAQSTSPTLFHHSESGPSIKRYPIIISVFLQNETPPFSARLLINLKLSFTQI